MFALNLERAKIDEREGASMAETESSPWLAGILKFAGVLPVLTALILVASIVYHVAYFEPFGVDWVRVLTTKDYLTSMLVVGPALIIMLSIALLTSYVFLGVEPFVAKRFGEENVGDAKKFMRWVPVFAMVLMGVSVVSEKLIVAGSGSTVFLAKAFAFGGIILSNLIMCGWLYKRDGMGVLLVNLILISTVLTSYAGGALRAETALRLRPRLYVITTEHSPDFCSLIYYSSERGPIILSREVELTLVAWTEIRSIKALRQCPKGMDAVPGIASTNTRSPRIVFKPTKH